MHKEGITLPKIKPHRDFKNNIIIVEVSDPWKFKEDTGVKIWKLVLKEEGENVQVFHIGSQVKILQINLQIGYQCLERVMDCLIVKGEQDRGFDYDSQFLAD